MTKKQVAVCKKKSRKKNSRLTGGNIFDDWINTIIHELGDIGRAIGNFVNDNMELFTTILVDLITCLIFPEFGLLEFTGSIISIAQTIAKYSSPNPNIPSVTDSDAKAALNMLMADDRWDTGFIQPVNQYMTYILGYITADTPAPVISDLGDYSDLFTPMTFDLHGLVREIDGGIVIYSLDYDINLSEPIIFTPSIQGETWTMSINGGYGGRNWTNGGSREQAIATLMANPAGFCDFMDKVSPYGGDMGWKYPNLSNLAEKLEGAAPYPAPFQVNNSKDIYPTIIKIMSQKTFPVS